VPIYEYRCLSCSEIFEAFQKITDEPLSSCKHCNGEVEKVFSQTSFQLKGSGWYLTDYSRKSQPSSSSSEPTTKAGEKSEKSAEKSSSPTPTVAATT
jgi:putative FmdB family regulatory protein